MASIRKVYRATPVRNPDKEKEKASVFFFQKEKALFFYFQILKTA